MSEPVRQCRADFSRNCGGCRHLFTEPWEKGMLCYRCGAEGRNRGYTVGHGRLLPYVPAWCPGKEDAECVKN